MGLNLCLVKTLIVKLHVLSKWLAKSLKFKHNISQMVNNCKTYNFVRAFVYTQSEMSDDCHHKLLINQQGKIEGYVA